MRVTKFLSLIVGAASLALLVGVGPAMADSSSPSCTEAQRAHIAGFPHIRKVQGVCILTRSAVTSKRRRGAVALRTGRLVDFDTTYGDNVFQPAQGKSYCKRGERVLSGGLRIVSTSGLFGGPARTSPGESAPLLERKKPPAWSVTIGSDLGGAARTIFRVVAECQRG